MKYVKKGDVIKAVEDNIAGAYLSSGWKPTTKDEYDRTLQKSESVKSRISNTYGSDN